MSAPGAPVVDFAPYAISQTQAAADAIEAMPLELQATARRLILELAANPDAHPLWTSKVDGATVYSHPDPRIQITYTLDEGRKVINVLHVAAPLRPRRLVFVSYSHKDAKQVAFLKGYLQVLEQQGLINLWNDEEIVAAEDWRTKIDDALQSSCAAVLMVTQEFLLSRFIQDVELPALFASARRLGTKIFWIHLSPSTVFQTHPQITAYQSPLPNPRKSLFERTPVAVRKKACVEISAAIQRALSA